MKARAEYQKELREHESEEEADLEDEGAGSILTSFCSLQVERKPMRLSKEGL